MTAASHGRDPDEGPDTFASLLRKARTERSLSQQKLADLAGLERKTVSRWETGTTQVTPPALVAVAKVLGWSSRDVAKILRMQGVDVGEPTDPASLLNISTTSSQVIAFLDRDEMNVTAEEREKLRATIDLVIWPYVKTHLIRQQAIEDVAREQAEARVERERREGAGG